MHGRLHVTLVPHLHGDLRPLIHVQGRAGDRPVVGEHAQLGALDVLAHCTDAQLEQVAVTQPHHTRARYTRQSGRLCAEYVLRSHLHHLSSSGADRRPYAVLGP